MNINYEDLEKIIAKLALEKHTVSFAESCTGGRLASAFTAISGASAVLDGSCVTYANHIKHDWLGVTQEVLDSEGAVSKSCVEQMLDGMQKLSKADYVLATSGIAGPTGGTELKPVGTVFIGLKTPLLKEVYKCFFDGSRASIQEQSTAYAILKLKEVLGI